MAVLARSSDTPRARNLRAPLSVVLGLLAVAALPATVTATRYSDRIGLVDASVAIAPAVLLGVWALMTARGARLRVERTLGRARGLRLASCGRALGVLALYLSLIAGLSLAVYGVLSLLAG